MADFVGAVKGLIGGFGACVCFALLFNAPKKCVLTSAFCGMTGYAVYMVCAGLGGSTLEANFFAAVAVAVLSEILAIRLKAPAIVFSMVGIVPIVPGAGLYRTILFLVLRDYEQALNVGTETLTAFAAIAMAVAAITALFRWIRRGGPLEKQR